MPYTFLIILSNSRKKTDQSHNTYILEGPRDEKPTVIKVVTQFFLKYSVKSMNRNLRFLGFIQEPYLRRHVSLSRRGLVLLF